MSHNIAMRYLILLLTTCASALQLDVTSQDNIKQVTSQVASNMMNYYQGNQPGQVPGLLPGGLNCNPANVGTYCWWEAGAMWGALINYWQYTGDEQYNSDVSQAMQYQRGADDNFNPANQSRSMGVDDQAFWAFTAMDAVEANFPEAGGDDPSWLALAQAVYNFQYDLWDPATCGGGFRWQVFSINAGYNLKNTVSNGGNFQLAARLAYVTGNDSYAQWANTVYDWMAQSKLMQQDDSSGILYIWDNTDTNNNCTDQTNYVWTYNYGIMLAGAAYMYNYTNGSEVWLDRTNAILNSTYSLFFPAEYGGNIMTEMQCESQQLCNEDQKSFKAFLARWMAVTALLVPSTAATINPKLAASAAGAASQCSGGTDGSSCGMEWYTPTWDGLTGVGQEMAAMSVIGATLNRADLAPLSKTTGAKSQGDPNAGSGAAKDTTTEHKPITTGDKAGAAILTVLIVALVVGGSVWLVI